MFTYGVISGPYFPVFGLNTDIYGDLQDFRIQSEYRKYRPEITSCLDTFHVVDIALFIPFPGDFTFLLQHDKIAKQDSKELKFTLSYFNKSQGLKLLKNFSPYFFVVVSEYYEHGVRV